MANSTPPHQRPTSVSASLSPRRCSAEGGKVGGVEGASVHIGAEPLPPKGHAALAASSMKGRSRFCAEAMIVSSCRLRLCLRLWRGDLGMPFGSLVRKTAQPGIRTGGLMAMLCANTAGSMRSDTKTMRPVVGSMVAQTACRRLWPASPIPGNPGRGRW